MQVYIYAACFLLGFTLGSLISIWNLIIFKTFEVEPVHLFQMLLTLLLATIIAYTIKRRGDFSVKAREVYLSLLNDFFDNIKNVHHMFVDYCKSPSPEKASEILSRFKNASVTLYCLKENCTVCGIEKQVQLIHTEFDAYQEHLTDSPFKSDKAVYAKPVINKISQDYSRLVNKIYESKIKLFS